MGQIKRRQLLLVGGALLGAPLASVLAQTPRHAPDTHRIGFLAVRPRSTPSHPDALFDAFFQGLRDLGYVEGKNLIVEWRVAKVNPDSLRAFAAELARMNPEVIVTHYSPAATALQQSTSSIPIVVTASNDPVRSGLAKSLSRPGGNVTGMAIIGTDLSAKQLELLKMVAPGLRRVAILANPVNPSHQPIVKNIQAAASTLGLDTLTVEANTDAELPAAFASIVREHAGAVIIAIDGFFTGRMIQLASLALKSQVASMYGYEMFTAAGGLISYGLDIADAYRRAAHFVDKILKGANAAELPFEQPTRIFLSVNRGTARALGLTLSRELLLRADRVIE